jgi:hypothetical protein
MSLGTSFTTMRFVNRTELVFTTKKPARQSGNQSRNHLSQRRKDAKDKKRFPNFAPWRFGERKSESEKICASRANLQS